MIGSSNAMLRLKEDVDSLSGHDFPVLVLGETGVGKELVASRLGGRPFVAINCGALAPGVEMAELFGSKAGAFTGAVDSKGAIGEADGGTLFLDEVAEASPVVQAALLRVLDSGVYRPVGGREKKSRFRLVSASCRLEEAVGRGQFRQDLFHRLSAFTIRVPPLRERAEDIADLVAFFTGVPFSEAALAAMEKHSWPGNVRELRSVVHAAVFRSRGQIVEPAHLHLSAPHATGEAKVMTTATFLQTHVEASSLEAQVSAIIAGTVAACNGNVREAARRLDVSRTTVYRYLALPAPTGEAEMLRRANQLFHAEHFQH